MSYLHALPILLALGGFTLLAIALKRGRGILWPIFLVGLVVGGEFLVLHGSVDRLQGIIGAGSLLVFLLAGLFLCFAFLFSEVIQSKEAGGVASPSSRITVSTAIMGYIASL
ncbi:MAG: hypothetical protein WCT41_01245 [Candidatus Paceibacterota bacterium]|jgi:hypothetical protein